MKWRRFSKIIVAGLAIACLSANGCSSYGGANQVVVRLSQTAATLIVTQSFTLTAIVTGATDTDVTWDCTFTTPVTSGTTTTTSKPQPCTTATGQLSGSTATQTTFTAPATVPNPAPTITVTATSKANTKKSATCTITLDSGIRVAISPLAASVPTGANFQFIATLINDSTPNDVTWQLTQATSIPFPNPSTAANCSPDCGSIDAQGLYTAPGTVPKTATVTVLTISKLDTSRAAIAAVTVVANAPTTFTGISPSIAAQGSIQQDIILTGTNFFSTSSILFNGTAVPNTQIKVITTPGATSSMGARLRLTGDQLATAGTIRIQVSGATEVNGPFNLQIVPVRPGLVASLPDSLPEGPPSQPLIIDGGFYGSASSPVVTAQFNSSTVAVSNPAPRQLSADLSSLGSLSAGLFQVGVTNNSATPSTAVTNLAVFPDYGNSNPAKVLGQIALTPGPGPTPATPSAMALDTVLGMGVVAEAATSTIEFFNMNGGNPILVSTPTPIQTGSIPITTPPGSVPTGVAVDESLHIAAVVNYFDRSLWVFQIPNPGQTPSTTPIAKIDLSQLIPTSAPTTPPTPPPFPYAVGIDPFTHLALVAFASTNVGFVVNLDPTQQNIQPAPTCLTGAPPYCPYFAVTLNTGPNPQIVFEPRMHLALVTPGGAGNFSGVDLTHRSVQVGIATASRTSNVVTITTVSPHNLNPGNPGSVLISGVSTTNTNFNGSFAVSSVIDANNFTYQQTAADDKVTGGTTTSPLGLVTSGTAFMTFSISPTIQGIAVNPETRTAVMADFNASFSQISFLDSLDQSVTGLSLFAGATGAVVSGSPEIGSTDVAYQPFSNTALSFNPIRNEVSMLDPVRRERLQIVPTDPTATNQTNGAATITIPTGSSSSQSLKLSGAMIADPSTNLALVANSGSSNITVLKLGNIKTVNISQVLVTSGGAPYSIPGSILPQATLTTNSTPVAGPSAPVLRILGSGFVAGAEVRLDGAVLPSATVVSDREIDVTVPSTFLGSPRHFALDVVSNGVISNATDFTVLQSVDVSSGCPAAATPQPGAVAIDEQRNLAVVANVGCGDLAFVSLNPDTTFGTVTNTVAVGTSPSGVAVDSGRGLAVVANNGDGTASVVHIDSATAEPPLTIGKQPNGVAINPETGIAVIANTGSNTVSTIDLNPLVGSPPGTLSAKTAFVDQQPLAVAIDPDRGTNNAGIAVVTALQLNGTLPPSGTLDVVDIGATSPSRVRSSLLSCLISATPTGIVHDPVLSPSLFYGAVSQGNTIFSYNPDTGSALCFRVGINPTSVAFNFQTGTLLTVNTLSNTISVVDAVGAQNGIFRTRATLGIGGSPQFAAAIHPRTNLAVITDQANNRVLLFPLPK